MPLYDYKCTSCGAVREVRHGFNESHDEPCSQCGAAMTRVFNPAPIVFKGSGFYVTDSRGKSTSATDATSGGSAKSDSSKTDSSGAAKGESAA